MRIAVLGTGTVGRTLAARLDELGHEVTIGTSDVATTRARGEADAMGNPPYRDWAAAHPRIGLASFAEAAAGAELIVNATRGAASIAVLTAAGRDNLAGKVLLDVTNPLDFEADPLPTLFVKDTDSLGEQLQAAFPDAKVVKALNTMAADVMVHPTRLPGDHTVFVCGNDSDAKKAVTGLLEGFGHTDVLDLGDISSARGTEMLIPIWVRVMRALNTQAFNFKIVR